MTGWKEAFRKRKFRVEFVITFLLLIFILRMLASFLNFVEARNGVTLSDPLLNLFEPVNLTWLTFGLIYVSLFTALYFFIKKPDLLLTALQSYILLIVFRIIAMYLLPLNPPDKMISLKAQSLCRIFWNPDNYLQKTFSFQVIQQHFFFFLF